MNFLRIHGSQKYTSKSISLNTIQLYRLKPSIWILPNTGDTWRRSSTKGRLADPTILNLTRSIPVRYLCFSHLRSHRERTFHTTDLTFRSDIYRVATTGRSTSKTLTALDAAKKGVPVEAGVICHRTLLALTVQK